MKGAPLNYSFLPLTPLIPSHPPPKIKNKLEDLYAEALNLCRKCGETCQKKRDAYEKFGLKRLRPVPDCEGAKKSKDVQIGTWGRDRKRSSVREKTAALKQHARRKEEKS